MHLPTGIPRRAPWILVALTVASCASPPHSEMDQAQGAIDAARAAGAERYAPAELAAASETLTHANEAVAARDYRLALNYALESREQAQEAARTAAETRAALRGEAERSLAEVKALLTETRARLDGARGAEVPRRARRGALQTLEQLELDLQKADAVLQAEDYMEAERLLTALKSRVQGVVTTISGAPTSQSPRRRG